MELIIYRRIDNPQLKSAWKKMEQANGVSPFLYYDYMRYIWQQVRFFSLYAPRVVCVMDEGKPLMLLPLKWDLFKHRYKMIGDTMGCGHADALFDENLSRQERLQCASFFYSHIGKHLKLARLPENSVLLESAGLSHDNLKSVNLTQVSFNDGVDALVHSLSRNGKESIRRAYNRLRRNGVEVELHIYKGQENPIPKIIWKTIMQIYLNRLYAKHKHGGKTGKGNLVYRYSYDFKSRYIKHDTKSLRHIPNAMHAVLMHNDKVVAFCLCMMDHHGEWLVNPRLAINDDYSFYSPGYVLLTELMRYLEKNTQCRMLDLSRGCEQYKMNLGGIAYRTYQINK